MTTRDDPPPNVLADSDLRSAICLDLWRMYADVIQAPLPENLVGALHGAITRLSHELKKPVSSRESMERNVFKVTADSGVGLAGFARDTAQTAIDKAVELIGQGVPNVRIVAPDGREYRPEEFNELSRQRNMDAEPT